MLGPTDDDFSEAHTRARRRIAARADARLPMLDYDRTVSDALNVLAKEKQAVACAHWKNRLWYRWHRRVERRIERKTGRPFRFNSISGHAVRARWLAVLSRFVRLDIERRFGHGRPVSLAHIRSAYDVTE